METGQVQGLLEEAFPRAEVSVEGAGCDLQLTVVSEIFEGLSKVRRQQKVYQCLNAAIADGSIHAVSMKTLTPEEARQQESN